MPITSLPVSYRTTDDEINACVMQSSLDGKERNEVIWSFDAITIWQDWFATRYGEFKELRHRSNPDDPPDLELFLNKGLWASSTLC